MGTKRSDAVDPPRPLRDKESNRQGTDPTSPLHPHLDENNLLWENQTTPLRGAPPRRDCPVDAGSSLEYWATWTTNLLPGIQCQVPLLRRGHKRGTVLQEEPKEFSGYTRLREVHNTSRQQLLPGIQCQMRVLQAGHKRGRVLQEEPICFFWRSARLREVPKWRGQQTISLLQGKQRQVPLLRRGLERGRVLQEEPIYWRLREEQELLPGIQCHVRVLQAGHQRGRVLQEGPIYFFWTSARLREVQLLQGKQYQVPLLRRGHKRGRVLQEEPIFWRLRAVHLLPGSRGQVRGLQAGHKRGTVLQEEPTKFSGYTRLREVHNTSR